MIHGERLISMKILIINDELTTQTATGRAIRALSQELREGENIVLEATSADDGAVSGSVRSFGSGYFAGLDLE